MTITVSKSLLLSKMQIISKIIPSKCSTPTLCNYLFEAKEGRLFIVGANDEGRIKTSLECIFDEDVKICVPTSIVDGLKTLPEQPIDIHIDPETKSIVVKYHGGKFEIVGYDATTYPQKKEIETLDTISITAEDFYNGIAKVINFAAEDGLRPIITSVLIEAKESGIFFVGTDGHGLGSVRRDYPNFKSAISVVISRAIASILKSTVPASDDELSIRVGSDWSEILFSDYEISFRNQEGRYPNWRNVVPKNNHLKMLVDTNLLSGAIKRTSVFSSRASGLIELKIKNNKLTVTAQDLDFSTAAEEILPAEFNEDKFKIGMKGCIMQEMLSFIKTERSRVTFSDPSKAILITPEQQSESEEITYLLMPMTIQ